MKAKKKTEKGLQKFTDFESVGTREEFRKFKAEHPEYRDELFTYLYKKLNEAYAATDKKEGDIDVYYNRIIKFSEIENDEFTVSVLRRERWYNNEVQIISFMDDYLTKYRSIPSVSQIATGTGISRVTIQKHLKERRNTEYYNEKAEMLRGMTETVLVQLYRIGIQDRNVRALNGFLNYFSQGKSLQPPQNNTQNNYIQINGMILSQENIKLLPPDQLKTIEDILKGTLIPIQEKQITSLDNLKQ